MFPLNIANYQYVAKKYIFDILQERYSTNESMVNRMTNYLVCEQDVKDFCQIVADAYGQGYAKAVYDYKEELRKIGYNVEVVSKTL